jgi:hypothetical protein
VAPLAIDQVCDLRQHGEIEARIAPETDGEGQHLFKSGIAGSLSEACESAVDSLAAIKPRRQAVGGGKTEIVVAVELELGTRFLNEQANERWDSER